MVRLVRAKKPWALAASALIMLGLTFLFTLGDYRVLAKVTTPQFKAAVDQAKTVQQAGRGLKAAFDKAKGEWEGKYAEGKALIIDPSDRAMWPQFLKMISAYFPDPEYGNTGSIPMLPKSRTSSRSCGSTSTRSSRSGGTDLNAEWFDAARPEIQEADASRTTRPTRPAARAG